MKVCVVGCERSGTSAVANLLQQASGWSLLDDPQEAWYIAPLAKLTWGGLTWRLWRQLRRHQIVKLPCFAAILPYLHRRFVGRFHAVYCVRDPRDNVASLLERFHNGAPGMAFDCSWLSVPATGLVDAMAWRWRRLLELAEEYRHQGGAITFIRYEDFCADKPATIRQLADVCRMPCDLDAIAGRCDEQYRKRWSKRIAGPQRWRQDLTGEQVAVIETICAPQMAAWGYQASTCNAA